MSDQQTKCGYVAVIGAPNAGKSTLVNKLTGTKVSIVSPKVQTTRTRVLGIVMQEKAQIILVDTPGIFKAGNNRTLEKAIVKSAWESLENTDVVLLVVDAARTRMNETKDILEALQDTKRPVYLALNKVDKAKKEDLMTLAQELSEAFDFAQIFMISALSGDGTDALLSALKGAIPQGPYLFPEDQASDMPEILLAAEITREKLFLSLNEELPYALTVETESWERFDNGDLKISQVILTARETHKKIILGKGGSMIKKVGTAARKELEEIMECKVHLNLFVKVRENWMDKDEHFSLWNLDRSA